jgi:osmotically-inducible protein OsmY
MYKKTDDDLKHEVMRELSWDTRTWNQKIDVSVDDGVVTLSGTAASYGQRKAAEAAAHRVFGVTDVANEILLKLQRTHSDAEIAHAVRQALEWDALVPDTQITSTVSSGWVKLQGKVNTLAQRNDAKRAVQNLTGVAGVINEIEIDVPHADVETLRESIEAALERRADREAERFRIELVDGEVNLFGRVHSWPEKKAVVGSVSHARGVKKINDHLRIDPYF